MRLIGRYALVGVIALWAGVAAHLWAQTPPAPLPTFFVLSGTAARDALTHRTVGNVSIGYGKDVSAGQRAYVAGTFWSTPDTSGGSAGGAYELVAWRNLSDHWRVVLGGNGEIPVGGIDASVLAIEKIGVEHESRSLRADIFLMSVTPINPGPTGDQVKQLALNLRLAFLNR